MLKKFFSGLVLTRAISRRFRRLALLESLYGTTVRCEVSSSLSQILSAAAKSDPDVLLKQLNSHLNGLSDAQAAAIRERVGLNEIEQEKPLSGWRHLWHCYKTPFDLLLTLLAVISYVTEDIKATDRHRFSHAPREFILFNYEGINFGRITEY